MVAIQKIYCFVSLLFATLVCAHPLPNTVVKLSFGSDAVLMNIQLPLQDFEIAYKDKVAENQNQLAAYFLKHIQIQSQNHELWQQQWVDYKLQKAEAAFVGNYTQIQFTLRFTAPKTADLRDFTIYYDAVMHEITNHQALVFIESDWQNGRHNQPEQIGIIGLDVPTATIYPLHVSVQPGSAWKGFASMVRLGMKHIAEGTDHLLFLWVLLLLAPFVQIDRHWVRQPTTRDTLKNILKIVTAFTVGHSMTLMLGTVSSFVPHPKPVELLIAFSIFYTAIHALKPLFSISEIYLAGGFGLIHGLAFSALLKELHLDTHQLVLSLLGFNIGIELMQLLVIVLVMPWLIILSQYKIYLWIRRLGAFLAIIASVAWFAERYTEKANLMTLFLEKHAVPSLGFPMFLALLTVCTVLYERWHQFDQRTAKDD